MTRSWLHSSDTVILTWAVDNRLGWLLGSGFPNLVASTWNPLHSASLNEAGKRD